MIAVLNLSPCAREKNIRGGRYFSAPNRYCPCDVRNFASKHQQQQGLPGKDTKEMRERTNNPTRLIHNLITNKLRAALAAVLLTACALLLTVTVAADGGGSQDTRIVTARMS